MAAKLGVAEFERQVIAALEEVKRALADGAAGRSVVALDQSSIGRLTRVDATQQHAAD
jgi:hypothetical protein